MQLHRTQQLTSWAFIPEKSRLMFTQKPAHEFSGALFIIVKNWKKIQMSFSGKKFIQTMVYPYLGILLINKKELQINDNVD